MSAIPLAGPTVYQLDGVTPVVHPSAFVHPTAVLIGDVVVGPRCYVGPGAVMRGDFGRIAMHEGANLQDNCVVHTAPDFDCVIEADGHIGHGAVLHGCRIGRGVLVGMNAVVMDRSEIGERAIVAAMSFVKIGSRIPPRVLAAGIPAKPVRDLTDEDIDLKHSGTLMYQELAQRCRATMRAVAPLTEADPDRPRIDWSASFKGMVGQPRR